MKGDERAEMDMMAATGIRGRSFATEPFFHGGGMDKQAGPAGMAGWEYKVVKIGPSSAPGSEAILNELGAVGWDLIVFQAAGERAYPGEGTYVFKRQRSGAAGVRS